MSTTSENSRYLALLKAREVDNATVCYVCLQVQQRKPSHQQIGTTNRCILCNNDFCNEHKSKTLPQICEINHGTYCQKAAHKARHAPFRIFSSVEEREAYISANGPAMTAGSSTAVNGERGGTVE